MNSQLETVFQNNFLHITLQQEKELLLMEWLRHPPSDAFRQSFQAATDFALKLECRYWLSDAQAMYYLEIADQNWLMREIAPRVAFSSLTKFARVMTQESLLMLDMQNIRSQVQQDVQLAKSAVQVEVFLDTASALEWLLDN